MNKHITTAIEKAGPFHIISLDRLSALKGKVVTLESVNKTLVDSNKALMRQIRLLEDQLERRDK